MTASSVPFAVKNLGCKVNRVESDSFIVSLEQAGGRLVPLTQAKLVIVNTCAVTGEAETKTRKAVRRALREAPQAQVFVTGCSAVLDAQVYREMGERVQVHPIRTDCLDAAREFMGSLASALDEREEEQGILWSAGVRTGDAYPTRMAVKVQDGCDNACTYCVVHIARGSSISRPLDQCVEEVLAAFDQGVREVVLTGVDLGCYRDGRIGLEGLLEQLLRQMPAQGARLRLSSIEPMAFDPRIAGLISSSQGRICAHLHLPLQSGCTRTLEQMGRPYSADSFAGQVAVARELAPSLSLTTDVIVGFPGETDEDFQASIGFCQEMGFSRIHVFRYSKRPGTPAAQRQDQVAAPVIAERSERLRALSAQLMESDAQGRSGTREQVLIESKTSAFFFGTSDSYHRVRIPVGPGLAVGDLVEVELSFLSHQQSIMDRKEPVFLEGSIWKATL